jgi:hypothetical protein
MILAAESLLFADSLIFLLHCRFAKPGSPSFGVSALEWGDQGIASLRRLQRGGTGLKAENRVCLTGLEGRPFPGSIKVLDLAVSVGLKYH